MFEKGELTEQQFNKLIKLVPKKIVDVLLKYGYFAGSSCAYVFSDIEINKIGDVDLFVTEIVDFKQCAIELVNLFHDDIIRLERLPATLKVFIKNIIPIQIILTSEYLEYQISEFDFDYVQSGIFFDFRNNKYKYVMTKMAQLAYKTKTINFILNYKYNPRRLLSRLLKTYSKGFKLAFKINALCELGVQFYKNKYDHDDDKFINTFIDLDNEKFHLFEYNLEYQHENKKINDEITLVDNDIDIVLNKMQFAGIDSPKFSYMLYALHTEITYFSRETYEYDCECECENKSNNNNNNHNYITTNNEGDLIITNIMRINNKPQSNDSIYTITGTKITDYNKLFELIDDYDKKKYICLSDDDNIKNIIFCITYEIYATKYQSETLYFIKSAIKNLKPSKFYDALYRAFNLILEEKYDSAVTSALSDNNKIRYGHNAINNNSKELFDFGQAMEWNMYMQTNRTAIDAFNAIKRILQ